jgi:putative ABC transport system ATP-binding protein
MAEDPLIELEKVRFAYGAGEPVLRETSFQLAPGGFTRVSGPSGAGKSTLLRLIARLEEPQAGVIRFRGRPLGELAPPRLRRALQSVQQTPVVLDGSVRENLLLPFAFAANRDLRRPSDQALREHLDEVRLGELPLDVNARTLSVGQQQRLCLVRGLLLDPVLLLLDEPTSALDDESAATVDAAIGRVHRQRGLAVLLVSHKANLPEGVRPTFLRLDRGQVVPEAPARAGTPPRGEASP